MTEYTVSTAAGEIRVFSYNTIIVGSGAAGFNAADQLYRYGQKDIAVVTENVNAGTSRNTGSDKQTYYKLTLSGTVQDSVREMAKTLFEGQCADGDIALCEASLSAECFFNLVRLGVPFPENRYGEYVGYKTDHDPFQRAASAGPYTSKIMTECLEKEVKEKGINIYDGFQVIRILKNGTEAAGLLCLDHTNSADEKKRFAAFQCKNIIYAAGGPAGIYHNSAYPLGHYGSTGIALEAGVRGRNLTEWQYGIASVNPRWNVSGTYMQVMPRFLSTDADGSDSREFLLDYFKDREEMLSKVFLKGYQWPFDVRKVIGGSSIIDILVHLETCRGRKVYLDFRENPGLCEIHYDALSEEAQTYLQRAEACFGTPIERLKHMNAPAVKFYKDRGIDLEKEPVEIAVCAQHNNGGLAVDLWWRTNLEGFFAVGEAAGSHGVYRPGGAALNAGQVGSLRAARYIAAHRRAVSQRSGEFAEAVRNAVEENSKIAACAMQGKESNVRQLYNRTAVRMSRWGALIRNRMEIGKAAADIEKELETFEETVQIAEPEELGMVYRLYDTLICQYTYLSAMLDFIEHGGKSRGSALYTDPSGTKPDERLPDSVTFSLDTGAHSHLIQEIRYVDGRCETYWRQVNPIPEEDGFFENVWRRYREDGNVY